MIRHKIHKLKHIIHRVRSVRRRVAIVAAFLIIVFTPVIMYTISNIKGVDAAWFNDNWAYRATKNISAHTAAETNVYLNLTGANDIDTSDTAKFQSDCGDLRFTDQAGNLLPYFIVSGCGTADTVVHVFLKSFPAGAQTFYYYYGNPSAPNGFSATDFATAASNVTFGTAGSEEKGPGPIAYWKFDDGTGTTTKDSTGSVNTGNFQGAPAWQAENMCVSGKCLFLDGSDDYVSTTKSYVDPETFTISIWFRTTTTTGGRLMGFGSSQTGVSTFYDRQIYMTDAGTLYYTVFDGGVTEPIGPTTRTYNDGKWHMATATMGADGMTFYIDGILIGTNANTTADNYTGYWRIGFDDLAGEPSAPTSEFFKGFLDEPKVYNFQLTAAQVKANYDSRGSNSAGAVLGASTDNNTTALSNGLTGYWTMNQASWTNDCSTTSVTDSSGNGKNGKSCPNTTGVSTTSIGKFGNAPDFNGTSQFVKVNTPGLPTGDYTYSAWVYPDVVTGTQTIFYAQDGGGSDEFFLLLNTDNIEVVTNNTTRITYSDIIPVTSWSHIVVTRQNGLLKLYLNGVQYATTANDPVDPSFSTCVLQIGNANAASCDPSTGGAGWYFNGKIDEARVYNRALSGLEVGNLYSFAPGPNAYYNFEEGTGSTVNDTSTYANTGTWNGTLGGQWNGGKYGKGGKFNGTNNYVDTGSSTLTANHVSVAAWVKLGSNAVNNFTRNIYTKGNFDAAGGTGLVNLSLCANATCSTASGTGSFGFEIRTSSGLFQAVDTVTAPTGVWSYVVGTFDGSNLRIYVNGVLKTTTSTAGTLETNTNVAYMGAAPNVGGTNPATNTFLNGVIDEARVYQYALTPAQITSAMNAGHPVVGSPIASPLGYWKMDDGYGNVASNSGSLGNLANAGLNNMAAGGGNQASGWNPNGKFGSALAFDGANDYAGVQQVAGLSTSTYTLSFWANGKDASSTSTGQTAIAKGTGTQQQENYGFAWSHTNSVHQKACEHSTATNTYVAAKLTSSLNANTWYYITCTYDGVNLKAYLNGRLEATTPAAAPTTGNGTLIIGASYYNAIGDYFPGRLDEVKVYNYPLTQSQILVDYNRGKNLVLGALSDTSQLTGGSVASNSAQAEYCVPGASDTCSSPVGRWDFEEGTGTSANDTTGNSNTGTFSGSPSFWNGGKYGKGGRFNGTDSLLNIPTSTSFDSTTGTWSGWFKTSASHAGTEIILIRADSSGSNNGVITGLTSSNAFILQIKGASSVLSITSTETGLNDGRWHHWAVTFNGTNLANMYIDGRFSISGTPSGSWSFAANPVRMGDATDTFWDHYSGLVDSVRIYNYVRTASQVAWEYNQGMPSGFWKLDECQGTSIGNSSGNNITGTLTIGASGSQTVVGTCSTPTDGTGAWYNGRIGKYNSSMNFDGTDDYINVTDNPALDMTTSVSISAWVKPATGFDDDFGSVIAKTGASNSVSSYDLTTDVGGAAGRIGLCVYSGTTQTCNAVPATSQLTVGNWYHVVGVYGASTLKTYINGRLVSEDAGPASINSTASDLAIGRFGAVNGSYWTGQIDDARVYNYALTPAQIKMVYNQNSSVRFGPLTGSP